MWVRKTKGPVGKGTNVWANSCQIILRSLPTTGGGKLQLDKCWRLIFQRFSWWDPDKWKSLGDTWTSAWKSGMFWKKCGLYSIGQFLEKVWAKIHRAFLRDCFDLIWGRDSLESPHRMPHLQGSIQTLYSLTSRETLVQVQASCRTSALLLAKPSIVVVLWESVMNTSWVIKSSFLACSVSR